MMEASLILENYVKFAAIRQINVNSGVSHNLPLYTVKQSTVTLKYTKLPPLYMEGNLSVAEATVVRIARNAGIDRMSEESGKTLVTIVNDYIAVVAQAAKKAAVHAGRKTVTSDDFNFVIENIV